MTTASVAVSTPKKDEDATTWLSIVAFGDLAETLARHAKGDMLAVTGRARMSEWTTREGEQRQTLEVIADTLVSARTVRPGGRRKADAQGQSGESLRASRRLQEPSAGVPFDDPIEF